jgi:hypothetical protein
MSEEPSLTDLLSGVCLVAALLRELAGHAERLARLERLDRQRRAYHERRLSPLGMPQRPRGRPKGCKNKPKPNGIDPVAVLG